MPPLLFPARMPRRMPAVQPLAVPRRLRPARPSQLRPGARAAERRAADGPRWHPRPRRQASAAVRPVSTTAATAAPLSDDATIYALSTAPGKAGIAVIRISGPACLHIYNALCPAAPRLRPRYAAVRTLYDPAARPAAGRAPADDSVLDEAVVLFFPAPRSVTGEDVLELHVHGGPATVRAVLAAIPRCGHRGAAAAAAAAARYAEPGEFTRRAFLHGRLDLAQVEALGDTLDAATEQQRRAAVRGASGRLGRTYEGWRAQLLAARAELEALIDFAEDQHFDEAPGALLAAVAAQVRALRRQAAAHAAAADRGSLLRHGIRIALVGPANAGKSSLMNRVVGREASIVSHEAGTTRDVVEARLDVRGFLCTFADTAGFRAAAAGAVEAEGIRRARQKAADADVVVVLASVARGGETDDAGDAGDRVVGADAGDGLAIRYDEETLQLAAHAQQCLVVVNKCDLVPDAARLARLVAAFRAEAERAVGRGDLALLAISCQAAAAATPAAASAADAANADPGGIHALVDALAGTFASMTALPADEQDLLGVTARQQQLLAQCEAHLDDFLAEAGAHDEKNTGEAEADIVIAAEHLRYAADSLSRITGRGEAGDVEEVLGVIFEKFCVGK